MEVSRPRHELNFSEIESRANAEFIGLEVTVESRQTKETRIVLERRDARESDGAAMARFVGENPHLVQAGGGVILEA